MVEDKRQDIFGYNPSGRVSELQNINSDAWPLISGSNLHTERRQTASNDKKQTSPQKKAPQPSGRRPAEAQKKPEQKKKSSYVSSSTGKAQKKKTESRDGRISTPPAGRASQRPERERKENKPKETVNNKKRQPERTPKGKRVQDVARPQQQKPQQQKQRKPEPEQLTKKQKKEIRRDNALYEIGTRQEKSKDELRREYQLRQIKRRKRKTVLAIFSFVIVVAFAFAVFIYNNVAIVNNINIEGNSTYSMNKIVKSCGVYPGDKLFSVREKRVKELLTNELPYIKDVKVDYKLPDTLTITVTPTEDKLMISQKNKYIRIDKDGKVVAVSKTKMKDGLYKIEGLTYKKHSLGEIYSPSEGEETRYEMAKSIALEAERVGMLSGVVNVKDMDKITFTYDGRIRIYLGNASELQSKMDFAVKTIAKAAPEKQTGYIDMRFSERGYFSEGSMDNT